MLKTYTVRWSNQRGHWSSVFYAWWLAAQWENALRNNGCEVYTDHQEP